MQVLARIQYEKGVQIGIGQGMNSEVFLAFDPQLGGELAVKEIPKQRMGNSPAAFFAEAQAMFAVAHPNILAVQYACETTDHVVIAMPYQQNGSLLLRIRIGPLPPVELLRIAQGVLAGLGRIHVAGYIHFDLKPANVLFSDTNVPLVTDFGQSRQILSNGTVQTPPLYMNAAPPETWQTGFGSHVSDIYQAGLLLYRAANGESVYREQLQQVPDAATLSRLIVRGRFPDRSRFLPHVPARLRTIIRKALRVNPAERYQSAVELAAALARVSPAMDWETTPLPNGEVRWEAQRPGRPSFRIELTQDSPTTWKTECKTCRGTGTRAFGRGTLWRSGMDRATAELHLRSVFETLEV